MPDQLQRSTPSQSRRLKRAGAQAQVIFRAFATLLSRVEVAALVLEALLQGEDVRAQALGLFSQPLDASFVGAVAFAGVQRDDA